ncbi:MAG: GGDEF domain-containing protein [Treponema sp.]|nr:GGDEF domain-containing protein [Treponema sp.]
MDLFAEEQQIYDDAKNHTMDVHNGAVFEFEKYITLANDYGKLLKQLRRATRLADRTTLDLFETNQDLASKVHYDTLTGIYNRRYLDDSLGRIVKSLSRSNGMLSIMMVDIDFFKKYNDTYGHSAGDICLREVAEILSRSITREVDFVARYGGEEFIIVLPHTDEHGSHIMASRLLKNIIERGIPHEQNEVAGCITVSIGVTTVKVRYNHKVEHYVNHADKALYMSKQNGRNRYTFLKFTEPDE